MKKKFLGSCFVALAIFWIWGLAFRYLVERITWSSEIFFWQQYGEDYVIIVFAIIVALVFSYKLFRGKSVSGSLVFFGIAPPVALVSMYLLDGDLRTGHLYTSAIFLLLIFTNWFFEIIQTRSGRSAPNSAMEESKLNEGLRRGLTILSGANVILGFFGFLVSFVLVVATGDRWSLMMVGGPLAIFLTLSLFVTTSIALSIIPNLVKCVAWRINKNSIFWKLSLLCFFHVVILLSILVPYPIWEDRDIGLIRQVIPYFSFAVILVISIYTQFISRKNKYTYTKADE